MGKRRNRAKPINSFDDRLMQAAEDLRTKARQLPPGAEQDALLKKAREFDAQISMNQIFTAP